MNHRLWNQRAQVQMLTLQLPSCVTLGKWLGFSVPQLSLYKIKIIIEPGPESC